MTRRPYSRPRVVESMPVAEFEARAVPESRAVRGYTLTCSECGATTTFSRAHLLEWGDVCNACLDRPISYVPTGDQ